MTQLVLCCCFQTECPGYLLCVRKGRWGYHQQSHIKNAGLLQGVGHLHSQVLLCWLLTQIHPVKPRPHQTTQQFTQEQSGSAVRVLKQNAKYPCQEAQPVISACLEIQFKTKTNKTQLLLSSIIKIQTHRITSVNPG